MSAYDALILSEAGVQSYFTLDDASGTTAVEGVNPGAQNGAYSGTCTLGQAGGPPGGNSVLFGGGKMAAPVNGNLRIMSVECWFRATAVALSGQQDIILCFSGPLTSDKQLWIDSAGKLVYHVFSQGNVNYAVTSPSAVGTGSWHHAVGVSEGASGSSRLYLDGVEVASSGGDGTSYNGLGSPCQLGVGGDPNGRNNPFSGYATRAASYTAALTASQVANHFAVGSSVFLAAGAATRNRTAPGTAAAGYPGSGAAGRRRTAAGAASLTGFYAASGSVARARTAAATGLARYPGSGAGSRVRAASGTATGPAIVLRPPGCPYWSTQYSGSGAAASYTLMRVADGAYYDFTGADGGTGDGTFKSAGWASKSKAVAEGSPATTYRDWLRGYPGPALAADGGFADGWYEVVVTVAGVVAAVQGLWCVDGDFQTTAGVLRPAGLDGVQAEDGINGRQAIALVLAAVAGQLDASNPASVVIRAPAAGVPVRIVGDLTVVGGQLVLRQVAVTPPA